MLVYQILMKIQVIMYIMYIEDIFVTWKSEILSENVNITFYNLNSFIFDMIYETLKIIEHNSLMNDFLSIFP